MKKLVSLLIIAVILFTLCGCDNYAEDIEGMWRMVIPAEGMLGASETYVFNADGSGTFMSYSRGYEDDTPMTFECTKTHLKVTLSDGKVVLDTDYEIISNDNGVYMKVTFDGKANSMVKVEKTSE